MLPISSIVYYNFSIVYFTSSSFCYSLEQSLSCKMLFNCILQRANFSRVTTSLWIAVPAVMTSTAATGQHGRSYESSQHGVTVVKGFQRLWQETLMCDTQLVVQGQSFNVHRAYLAACSQYFYSMFTKDFQEKSQNQVISI